jgi:hypothetical protein
MWEDNMLIVLCLLVILLLSGCVNQEPSDKAIQTAIAQTQAAQQSTKNQLNTPIVQETPSITEITPMVEDGRLTDESEDAQGLTLDSRLLAYDLEEVKTENGITTYQVGVAIQNISDQVVISTIPSTEAQVVTDDGRIFPAQFGLWINQLPVTLDKEIHFLIPPCAVVVEKFYSFHSGLQQIDGYLFSFDITHNLIPTTLKVLGFPDIDLEHVNSSDQLRFSTTCLESKLPLTVNTEGNIKVTFSNPRKIVYEQKESILTFDVDLENLNNVNLQKLFLNVALIDPEGSLWVFSSEECSSSQRSGNVRLGKNDIGPGQLVKGEVCFNLKSDSYYAWPIWEKVDELHIAESQDIDGTFTVEGIETTFQELRNGIELADGRRLVWYGNKRTRQIDIFESVGEGRRARRNLGDLYYLAIWVDNHTGWATFQIP